MQYRPEIQLTVISLSKIENLKAIHNYWRYNHGSTRTVISLSKIENLKAIHNTAGIRRNENMKQESETGKSNRDLATIKPNPGFTVYMMRTPKQAISL